MRPLHSRGDVFRLASFSSVTSSPTCSLVTPRDRQPREVCIAPDDRLESPVSRLDEADHGPSATRGRHQLPAEAEWLTVAAPIPEDSKRSGGQDPDALRW